MTPMQPPFSAYGREPPALGVDGCDDHGSSSGWHELLPSLHGQQVESARPHAESGVSAISVDRSKQRPATPGYMLQQGRITTGPCLDRQMDKGVVFATILERKDRKAAIPGHASTNFLRSSLIAKIKVRPCLAALPSDLCFSGMAISGR